MEVKIVNLSTYVYMATFKCRVNCGNLCLTISLDVEECKLNYQWAQFEDGFWKKGSLKFDTFKVK